MVKRRSWPGVPGVPGPAIGAGDRGRERGAGEGVGGALRTPPTSVDAAPHPHPGPAYAASSRNTSAAAPIVRSITSSSCERLTNAASNWLGAR